MTDEERGWRKAFEMIGSDMLRMQLVQGQVGLTEPYGRCALQWLREQQAATDLRETMRFETIRRWTVTAALAGIVAAVTGALLIVWPTH